MSAPRARRVLNDANRPPDDAPDDLVVLVPDQDIEAALRGLLSRASSFGCRALTWQIFRHPYRDNGCLKDAHEFLRSQSRRFARALVVFDRHGCGDDASARDVIEAAVERRLASNGWDTRAGAVVIDPEVEAWVWSPSPRVDLLLGCRGRTPSLRETLAHEGFWPPGAAKPSDPKRALDLGRRLGRRPRTSALFEELARTLPLDGCEDLAYRKLVELLRRWFPHG